MLSTEVSTLKSRSFISRLWDVHVLPGACLPVYYSLLLTGELPRCWSTGLHTITSSVCWAQLSPGDCAPHRTRLLAPSRMMLKTANSFSWHGGRARKHSSSLAHCAAHGGCCLGAICCNAFPLALLPALPCCSASGKELTGRDQTAPSFTALITRRGTGRTKAAAVFPALRSSLKQHITWQVRVGCKTSEVQGPRIKFQIRKFTIS